MSDPERNQEEAGTCQGAGASSSLLDPLKPRHFYGRRKGRKLSKSQLLHLEDNLTHAKVDLSAPAKSEEALRQLFTWPIDEIWLEIGFGGGEHMVWQLARHARVGVIGAEPFINGVSSALAGAQGAGAGGRLRCHADDVMLLLDWLPRESLSRAFMLFPDPWPKKRHRWRRLFSHALLDKLLPALKPGAQLRFASDILDYAEQAEKTARARSELKIAQIFTSANRDAVLDWPQTRYEAKAVREGRSSTFLIMIKV